MNKSLKNALIIGLVCILVASGLYTCNGKKKEEPIVTPPVVKVETEQVEPEKIVVEAVQPEEIVVKKEIKVMSFNIRRGNWIWGWDMTGRRDKIVEIIATKDADIFCLQEALKFQYDDMKKSFPDFGSYGVARGNGKEWGEY
jgi:mRNA deadenylase 3'-5' endonuclease subunit Ccr4